jgi:hypothetical protein
VSTKPLPEDPYPTTLSNKAAVQTASDEDCWQTLYCGLRPFIASCIRNFPVPSWQGQESDIIDDIVQESMRKILERIQKAEHGDATPIQSLTQISMTIAYNTYRDYRRRDRHLCHVTENSTMERLRTGTTESTLEQVTEQIFQEQIFTLIVRDIAHFPTKQKDALLTDLANRMSFSDDEMTPLQHAFYQVGIAIHTYQHPRPTDKAERYRYASILNHAYKRIRTVARADLHLEN